MTPPEPLKNYLVRRISAGESYDDLLRFPRYFEIETVNACNARCPMCTIEEWSRHAPTMKDELFAKIADDLIAHKDQVKRVSLYRDGEPLLDKKLAPRIARLKQGGIREVAISSNMSLMSQAKADALLDAGLDLIIMSIDSLKKDVFEAIRVKLIHEEVMANALGFIRRRNEKAATTRIWVRMVRQDSNESEWPDFERFWRAHLGPNDRVAFHNVHNWGNQLKGFKAIEDSAEPNLPCVALWSLMIIFADGRVPLCNVDYNNKHPSGSVADQSIAEIWQSPIMAKRRALHLDGHKDRIDICGGCNVWDEPSDAHKVAEQFGSKVTLG